MKKRGLWVQRAISDDAGLQGTVAVVCGVLPQAGVFERSVQSPA
jgi:hypothetical protein